MRPNTRKYANLVPKHKPSTTPTELNTINGQTLNEVIREKTGRDLLSELPRIIAEPLVLPRRIFNSLKTTPLDPCANSKLLSLPPETLLSILSHVPEPSLYSLTLTCKPLTHLILSNSLLTPSIICSETTSLLRAHLPSPLLPHPTSSHPLHLTLTLTSFDIFNTHLGMRYVDALSLDKRTTMTCSICTTPISWPSTIDFNETVLWDLRLHLLLHGIRSSLHDKVLRLVVYQAIERMLNATEWTEPPDGMCTGKVYVCVVDEYFWGWGREGDEREESHWWTDRLRE